MPRTGSNFTNGLSVYGVPILPTVGNETTTGNVFFVDSGNTNAADDSATSGKTKDRPFATIDYAINQCTANNGDVIYVLPGHTENITSITSIVPDVAGISIIGLGRGEDRPELVFATGTSNSSGRTSSIKITGDGTRISNMVFTTTASDSVKPLMGIRVQADDVQIDNCFFTNGSSSGYYGGTNDGQLNWGCSSGGGVIWLGSTVGGTHVDINNVKIINNEFACGAEVGGSSSGTCIAINLGSTRKAGNSSGTESANIDISFNKFVGDYSHSVIYGYSSGTAHKNMRISFNDIYNHQGKLGSGSSGTKGFDIAQAVTGICAYNNITCVGSTDVDACFDAGSLLCVQNYAAVTVGVRGLEVPRAPDTT